MSFQDLVENYVVQRHVIIIFFCIMSARAFIGQVCTKQYIFLSCLSIKLKVRLDYLLCTFTVPEALLYQKSSELRTGKERKQAAHMPVNFDYSMIIF